MKSLIFTLMFVLAANAIAAAADISVATPWSRPAITTGIVYLTVKNAGSTPERLVKITTPIAKAAELHQSMEMKEPMGNVESMKPVTSIAIPAHGSVKLSPGGYHVMLVELRRPLQAGQTFPIRLHFEHAPSQTVTVHVNAN